MTDRRGVFATQSVAHDSLKGQIDAPRFDAGTRHRVATPTCAITATPGAPGLERQLRYGQSVTVLEREDTHAFARADTMGYVGYVPVAALRAWVQPTHRVTVRSTLLFADANFKTPCPLPLSLGSQVTITGQDGRFAQTDDGHWLPAHHIAPLGPPAADPVAVAEQLLDTPYLWGGNSAFGIDCSGLVELGLNTCACPCPGDSDQQESTLGITLPPDTPPQRGDLMFWKGHVAWLADTQTLLHANVFHMCVTYEPLADAITRIAKQGDGPVTRHARLTE